MRKLYIVLAAILIYVFTLEVKSAFNNSVASTINLTDYVTNAITTIPLSTFKENSLLKIESSKIGRLRFDIEFKNATTSQREKIEKDFELELVDVNNDMQATSTPRYFRTNSRSIIMVTSNYIDTQTYYLRLSSRDQSIFDDGIELRIRYSFVQFHEDQNPSSFSTARSLGTLSKKGSVNVVTGVDFTSDYDLVDFYSINIAQDMILEIDDEQTRGRDYFVLDSQHHRLLKREHVQYEIEDSILLPISKGTYFVAYQGYTDASYKQGDLDFVIKDSNLKFKKSKANSTLKVYNQYIYNIVSDAFSYSTPSTTEIFTSMYYDKSNGVRVTLPVEFKLNKLDPRCKNKAQQKVLNCDSEPSIGLIRNDHTTSIGATITSATKKGKTYTFNLDFGPYRDAEFTPDLQQGRFVFKL